MCGIAGIFGKTEGITSVKLKRMCNLLAHRGPDHTGIFEERNIIKIGHTRLAIQDLSEAGHQPMKCHEGRFVISFNGEIYNHLELRAVLNARHNNITWRGNSDTETFLEYIREFGINQAVEDSRGMFAFAIFDRLEQKLHLGRDIFGQKPLYFYADNECVAFASELPALLSYFDKPPEINKTAVSQFLILSFIPSPITIYKNIYKLQPGEIKTFEIENRRKVNSVSDNLKRKKFEKPDRFGKLSYSDAKRDIEKILIKSIKEHTLSDKPIGVFLSGGIDSSLIASILAREINLDFTTFTIGYENSQYDETHAAKKTAAILGVKNINTYITDNEILQETQKYMEIQNEPFADVSYLSTHILCKIASENVSVCLGGDGADELFGGYNRYIAAKKLWPMRKIIPSFIKNSEKIRNTLLEDRFYSLLTKIPNLDRLTKSQYQKIVRLLCSQNSDQFYLNCIRKDFQTQTTSLANEIFKSPDKTCDNSSVIRNLMNLDVNIYLPDNVLMKSDLASMRYSLELRAPFLDKRVQLASQKLADQMLIQGRTGKIILRDILKQHMPTGGWNLNKKGFTPPLGQWMRGPLAELIGDSINSQFARNSELLSMRNIQGLWDDHLSGKVDASEYIWSIFCLLNFLNKSSSQKSYE